MNNIILKGIAPGRFPLEQKDEESGESAKEIELKMDVKN